MNLRHSLFILLTSLFIIGFFSGCSKPKQEVTLLNVSYDPTRELYAEYNDAFAKHWKDQTGEVVTISTSNGGSGSQSRLIQDGSEADVATLGLGYDIDAIYEKGSIDHQKPLIPKDWQSRLPHNSSPYTSTIVFLVRKGNPKNIKDWNDLTREDVSVPSSRPIQNLAAEPAGTTLQHGPMRRNNLVRMSRRSATSWDKSTRAPKRTACPLEPEQPPSTSPSVSWEMLPSHGRTRLS